MRKLGIAVLVLALAGVGLWLVLRHGPEETKPSIAVITPAAHDAWKTGEVRTVAWTARNVPAGDKISLIIRRIPPPPLPEEGQEFDPIIATNLPNTGRAEWTISPMHPNGTYVLEVHAYAAIPVRDEVIGESAPFSIMHPALSSALYPLYAEAEWGTTTAETVTLGTTAYTGASIASATSTETMDPSAIFSSFMDYYDAKLTSTGWSAANDLAAGGHVGGQAGYRKDGEVILTRFHVVYENVPKDAPSECPCTVTLSVFSGK